LTYYHIFFLRIFVSASVNAQAGRWSIHQSSRRRIASRR